MCDNKYVYGILQVSAHITTKPVSLFFARFYRVYHLQKIENPTDLRFLDFQGQTVVISL